MKPRSTLIQGGLALLALAAAYLTWQRPKEAATVAESVTVLDADKQSLEKLRYEDGTRFLELTRTPGDPPATWLTMGFLPGKLPAFDAGLPAAQGAVDGGADAGVDAGAIAPLAVAPPEPPPTRLVKGNERADQLWARFTPFDAARALGVLAEPKLTELGLDGAERRLDVTVAGTAHTFYVSRPQSGVIGTWLKEAKTGTVYLLQGALFSELDPSSQVLVDRRLHTFRQPEFDRFTVVVGEKRAEYVQTNADIPQTAKVASAATPDKPDELAKNWHDKIWNRLVVTEVLGKDELPKAGEPKVELRLEYQGRGKAKGWLEVGFDPKHGTWARSENTAGWVAVHQGAEDAVVEAKKLVGP